MLENCTKILVILVILITLMLIHVTNVRCKSEKKNYFMYCLVGMLFYALGYLMEITSSDTASALAGVKVMYVGACTMSPMFLIFIADYCDCKIIRKLRFVLMLIVLLETAVVWTVERNHLMYSAYRYSSSTSISGLEIVKTGPLYYLTPVTSIICILISSFIIIGRMKQWNQNMRRPLLLMLLGAWAPVLSNLFYIMTTYVLSTNAYGLNFTPYALAITNVGMYLFVLKYDLFDFASGAYVTTLDVMRDGLIYMDTEMKYIDANRIAKKIFPDLTTLPKGESIENIVHWPTLLLDLTYCPVDTDIRFRLSEEDGRVFTAWVNKVTIEAQRVGYIVLIQDITENNNLMLKLENAAYTDELTGLYNRRHFMELSAKSINQAAHTGTEVSVIIFDLDWFKRVNDTYGHLAGDMVLKVVSATVRSSVREYDILARYGGEEFVILSPDSSTGAEVKLAERLRAKLEVLDIFVGDAEGTMIRQTCSFGVASSIGANARLDDLLARADNALYMAKNSGRNRVCVSPENIQDL
ncbi:MAG: diguanylate cyclase [Clostridiales Family XIII bacterium]|nr:diguanylate cyclase [Clostridiales Family XIII bacterium]